MIETMNATARVWVYQSNRPLTDEEWQVVGGHLNKFIQEWNAHGNALVSSFEIKPPFHFALIVDESKSGASGCSIDSSVHQVKALEEILNVSFFERQNIVYYHDGNASLEPMNSVIQKIKEGSLPKDRKIANTLVENYIDWNENLWIAANESWLSIRL